MKNRNKLTCAVLSAAMLLSSISFSAFATEQTNLGSVKVIVENKTFTSPVDGVSPKFTGELLNTDIQLSENSTMNSVILEALKNNNISQTGVEQGWITEIGGLNGSDSGSMGSWMYTLNDWFTDNVASAYTVEAGTLSDGDEITLCYTTNWGADLDYDWSGTDTSLKDIEIIGGTLSPSFNKECTSYKLYVNEDAEEIRIKPTAVNKNFKVTMSSDDKTIKRTTQLPNESAKVDITCGSGDNASEYTVEIVPYLDLGTVHFVVENSTFLEPVDGVDVVPSFTGILLETNYKLKADSNILSVIIDSLAANNISQKGAEAGWITEVGGIRNSDGGSMGSWMYTLNDWFVDDTGTAFSVESNKLSDGDEIRLCYTLNWGADLGYDWSGTDTSLVSLDVIGGKLEPSFDKDTYSYNIKVDENSEYISVIPTALNKSFNVSMIDNNGETIKRTSKISPETIEGIEITVGAGDNATIYTIGVIAPVEDENDDDKPEQTDQPLSYYYASSLSTFLNQDFYALKSGSSEWMILSLARSGVITDEIKEEYITSLIEELNKIDGNILDKDYSTLNSKIIIALSALEIDASNFNGKDLTEYYSDIEYIKQQGINGPIFAIIAANTMGIYADTNKNIESIVDYLVENQLTEGGWALFGDKADIDITSMAVTALAPYYNYSELIKTSIDKALNTISKKVDESTNCESLAQIITALSELGIVAENDDRFILSDGKTLLDLIKSYATEGGFTHNGNGYNQIATEQACYALTSFYLVSGGKSPIYNMTNTYPMFEVTPGESSDVPSNPPTGNQISYIALIGSTLLLSALVIKRRK